MTQKSREDVFEVLRARFAHIPLPLEAKIQGIESLSRLNDLLRQAVTAASLQEFQKLVNAYKD